MGIRFEAGAPVRVTDASGGVRDVTNRALSPQEIMSAIAPIVPEDMKRQVAQQPTAAFDYACPGVGAFTVVIRRDGDQIAVAIDPAGSGFGGRDNAGAAGRGAGIRGGNDRCRSEGHRSGRTQGGGAASAGGRSASERGTRRQGGAGRKGRSRTSGTGRRGTGGEAEAGHERLPASGANAIDRLFYLMFERKASDLHLSAGMPPLIRKDGEIEMLEDGAAGLDAAAMAALLDPIMPPNNRDEFARRHDTDFAYEIAGLARFRCNIFMDRKGPGAVFRVIPSKILTAEDLGLSPYIMQLCRLSKGLLVTGPTGSGKSTTLCAMVDYINRNRADHIITIEDPIEFVHENKKCLINQREVHTHTDGFKDALRAALREDPDIVLVGEMRDLETVAIAIETAETGHLVFGTLHTTTAASTVDRVIDQFPTDRQAQIRIMLSESLKGRHRADALQEDRRRPHRGARSADRHRRRQQPDSGVEDLPDPLDHAGRQVARHGGAQRRADGAGDEEARRAGRGVLEVGRQEQLRRPAQARRLRHEVHGRDHRQQLAGARYLIVKPRLSLFPSTHASSNSS